MKHEASRVLKQPHLDGNSRNEHLLSSMPSISNLAMNVGHPDALDVEFPHSNASDNYCEENSDDGKAGTRLPELLPWYVVGNCEVVCAISSKGLAF